MSNLANLHPSCTASSRIHNSKELISDHLSFSAKMRLTTLIPLFLALKGASATTPSSLSSPQDATSFITTQSISSFITQTASDAAAHSVPPFPLNTTNSDSSSPRNSTITYRKDTPPAGYHFEVYSSDCPCDRWQYRFCTEYRRSSPVTDRCYAVSHPCLSMRAHDPLVARNNPLLCWVYEHGNCTGQRAQAAFTDNTMCKEPSNNLTPFKFGAIRCKHYTY